ncbi:MAG: hypothetical protein ACM3IJ_03770 [Candidatus Levyibacteriota bacterium]
MNPKEAKAHTVEATGQLTFLHPNVYTGGKGLKESFELYAPSQEQLHVATEFVGRRFNEITAGDSNRVLFNVSWENLTKNLELKQHLAAITWACNEQHIPVRGGRISQHLDTDSGRQTVYDRYILAVVSPKVDVGPQGK